MKELLKQLNQAMKSLENFGKFKHLFSKDNAEKELAELRQLLGQIYFQVKASTLKEVSHPKNQALQKGLFSGEPGMVSIRPCGDKYKGKTYIGFYIGDIALSSSISISDDKISCNFAQHNPAIYVPELSKVIYGCESWWGKIKSVEDARKISNDDINNVWYVKLLKAMDGGEPIPQNENPTPDKAGAGL